MVDKTKDWREMPVHDLLKPEVFAEVCSRLDPEQIREVAKLFASCSVPPAFWQGAVPHAAQPYGALPFLAPAAARRVYPKKSASWMSSSLGRMELAILQHLAGTEEAVNNNIASMLHDLAEQADNSQCATLPDPPERERKTERIYVRLTATERSDLSRAAAIAGMSLTDFITQAARRAVTEVLENYYVIHLGREASENLRRLLEEPPKPSEEVLERFRTAPKAKEA